MIELTGIIIDPNLQMRHKHDPDFVDTLAELLEDADKELDPVILFAAGTDDDMSYRIGDGNHRVAAYHLAKRKRIPAIVHDGGYEAALKYALGANADQRSKPRTRKDLRKAVLAALEKYYFNCSVYDRLTQAEIAEICRTSQMTVSRIIRELEGKDKKPEAKAPEQLDFWEQLTGEFQEMISQVRVAREAPAYLAYASREPEKAAQYYSAIADELQQEYRELKRLVASIQEGIARSK